MQMHCSPPPKKIAPFGAYFLIGGGGEIRLSARSSPSLGSPPSHLASPTLASAGPDAHFESLRLAQRQTKKTHTRLFWPIAEAERFELSVPFGTPPFQGGGINRYPTPPFFNHGKELPL
ncbi:MAG: hypothetical protein Greene07147_60 [Parcubacteria group bacterium Greene0714_7]|nr:MAG: hypothetical protein Greene07147_60 [Parcubacteria group bacterium Greene0714_7]